MSWLRFLGGKLAFKIDLDGLYVLLAGIGSVFATVATVAFAALQGVSFEPSAFRLYHPIHLRHGVYQVSDSIFAAPLFETVKGHEPSGPGQAYSVDGTHQRYT